MTDENDAVTDDSGATPGRTARGLLWTVVGALLLAAAALAGASALPWVEVPPGVAVDGRVGGDLSGGDVASWPVPMALLALAAVAASLALPGVVRRVLGGLLVLVGVWVVWLSTGDVTHDLAWMQAPGYDSGSAPTPTLWGPAAAVAGGALVAVAGAVLVWRGHRMPRMGARYSAPGRADRASARPDSDRELWNALTEGDDPTAREG